MLASLISALSALLSFNLPPQFRTGLRSMSNVQRQEMAQVCLVGISCELKLFYSLIYETFYFGFTLKKKLPLHCIQIGGFHVTSSPPCWWTKTKDLSLASFAGPPEVVHFSIVIGVPRGWLKTSCPLIKINIWSRIRMC